MVSSSKTKIEKFNGHGFLVVEIQNGTSLGGHYRQISMDPSTSLMRILKNIGPIGIERQRAQYSCLYQIQYY